MDLDNIKIFKNNTISCALKKLQLNKLKALIVVDKKDKLLGMLNDANIRRAIISGAKIQSKINRFYVQKKDIYYVYENEYNFKIVKKKLVESSYFVVPIINNNNKLVNFISFKDKNNKNNFFQKFPVLIMAGGKGERMKPFTNVLPKPLIPINDIAVLEHIINNFLNQSIKKFFLSINSNSEILKAFIQNLNHKLKINVRIIKEKKPLGTCGSIKLLENRINEDFFVCNCDTLIKINFNEAMKFHKKKKNILTIVGCKKTFKIPYGILHVNKNNELKLMSEKPIKNFYVNTGVYIFNNKIFKKINKGKQIDMNDLIKKLKKNKNKISIFKINEEKWSDVGQWDQYKKTIENYNESN